MKRGGRFFYEPQAAAEFRRLHRDDPDGYVNRGRAQRLRGKASRQQGIKAPRGRHQAPGTRHQQTPELRNSGTPELHSIPTTPEELDRLARAGQITQAGLAIAEKTISLRARMREEAEADGRLLPRDQVVEEAARQLAEIRAILLNLPARAAASAAAMLTLEPARQAALREMLEREVDAAMLAAGGEDLRNGQMANVQMVKEEEASTDA